jgi:predicted DNA-binding transcriptional regulator YafY
MAQLNPDTLRRQWLTLHKIPRYPHKITARDLYEKLLDEGFDVGKRTIERDLQSLSALFPLVLDDRDKPYGWSWKKDAPLFSLPGLSNAEALTLAMVEQHLNSLLPRSTLQQLQPYFAAAKHTLDSTSTTTRQHSWLNKVRTVPPSQPLLPPVIKPAVQDIVYAALLADKQLDIKYNKRGQDKASSYRIHPLAVVQRGHLTYLCCRFGDYEDLRTLAIHRIQSATLLDDAAVVPKGFAIDEVIAAGKFGFRDGELITLQAIFYNGAGDHLFETPLTREQQLIEQADDSLKLVAQVPNTLQLGWWLLGFGDNVEVLHPVALRRQMSETIANMQARYQK